jgi:glycosyltransferase involved in cell wall biosynthesis
MTAAVSSGRRVRHILVVTRSYPPLNVVSSLRTYQWAKYWLREDVRVTVLTTRKHGFYGPCDSELPPLPGVRVVEVEFLPALAIRILERFRASKSPVETGVARGGGRLIPIKFWLRRLRLSSRWWPTFEFYDLWTFWAVRAGRRIIADDPVDVVVSSFGPPACHQIGSRLKRRFPKLLWVADYRDPWTFHDGFHLRGLSRLVERRRERAVVERHADLLLAVSEPLAEQTRRFVTQPVLVVENGFDPEEMVSQPRPAQPPDTVRRAWAPITLVYTGSLVLAYQDPTPLLQALRQLGEKSPAARARLKILIFGERQTGLQDLIEQEGVADRALLMGYVDRPTALWAQRHASALLLLDDQSSAARGVLRAKMFEYMQAGRPILGIGFDRDTEVGRILTKARVGRVCGADPGVIQEALQQLAIGGEVDGFAPDPTSLARFRRDLQARRLLAAMEGKLEPRSGSNGRIDAPCSHDRHRISMERDVVDGSQPRSASWHRLTRGVGLGDWGYPNHHPDTSGPAYWKLSNAG